MSMIVQGPAHSGASTETTCDVKPWTWEAFDRAETVWGLFEKKALEHPDKTAVIDGGAEIDYEHLRRRAIEIAAELVAQGVEPGSLVGVCMGRGWELTATLMGILRAGCAYVPLDPAYPQERLRYMVEHARLAAAVVDDDTRAERCVGSSAPAALKVIHLGRVSARARALSADAPFADAPFAGAPVGVPVGPSPRDLAYVIYTSGSTGRPKGVAVEHRSVVALSRSMRTLLSDEELSGVLASASISFDASVMEILGTLTLGGTVVLAENVLALLELPAADRVKTCVMVPSAMKALLAAGRLPESLRCVVLGAEVLTPSLVSEIHAQDPSRRVINVYGPTEDTVYATTAEIPVGAETTTIGRSVPGSRSYVLDDSLQPVPDGAEGELYLAGDKLARGYLHEEDLTRERFLEVEPGGAVPEERLYRTGDLCRRGRDGRIEFLGRIDQQVKIRGHRIELEEIESTLESMDGVDGAAAAAADGGTGRKVLVAYVVSRRGTVTREAARAYVAERLPGYMVPQAVVLLDELPRLPNDKLDRSRLSELGIPTSEPGRCSGRSEARTAPGSGRSELVDRLAGLTRAEQHGILLATVRREIASLLRFPNVDQVQADELLDDLGLDSLTKVELSARLGGLCSRKLPVSAAAKCATPAAVADLLLELTGSGTAQGSTQSSRDRSVDTLAGFQTQIQGCYPPFLAGKAPAWSATDKGTLVQQLKQLVSRPGDPFCKLVRTGSGHRGVVADVDTDRAREAIIWTTNLYLGLNRDPEVIAEARSAVERFGTGMGTSAAASGITDVHQEFEQAFADLVGKPSACLFPTGYTANMGAVAGLLGHQDVIVMDQLCHASIVDGARLCGATIRTFQHNNPADLEAVLRTEASPYRTVLVVLEGVYSMGEGAAPVSEIARIAKRYGALVLVDEAHSFGFYGRRGAGICAEQGATEHVDFIMTTLSKALGSLGGVVAAREEHVALLKSSSRAFIFQASTSPADIAAALAALRRLSIDDSLRERLWDTTAYMRKRFSEAGYDLGTGDGPIVTPHFHDKEKLFAIVNGLFERGVHTSAVTYPIVESGRGRLRFICSAAHSRQDVDRTLEALIDAEREAEAQQSVIADCAADGPSAKLEAERVWKQVHGWTEAFAGYLEEWVLKVPDQTPNVAVSFRAIEAENVISINLHERTIRVGDPTPTDASSCSLLLTDHRAVAALCSSSVQGLLDHMLKGTCVLNGQVEAFVWLIGRMTEWNRVSDNLDDIHK